MLEELKKIPDNTINMVITSPPYWGLRNYNTNPQIWDGAENCDHEWESAEPRRQRSNNDIVNKDSKQATQNASAFESSGGDFCIRCGAWKGELGSEPIFKLYIKHMCDIFDEVNRTLTVDGTCWVNLGDTYSANRSHQVTGTKQMDGSQPITKQPQAKDNGLKEKCLCQIPNRFSIEMTDRGWILRNEIIWHKPNAMPSSVRDRFTVDYEKLFLFSKNKKYYFEQQKEPVKDSYNGKRGSSKTRTKLQSAMCGDISDTVTKYTERNKRSMWSINTQPLKDAHFAVFPEELVKTPINAGCPENGIVMDIFMGSGTTALVAKGLNRNYIGIELNPEYINIANNRINA